jgi:hypothetical protein
MGGDARDTAPALASLARTLGRDHPEVRAVERGEMLECDIEPTAL